MEVGTYKCAATSSTADVPVVPRAVILTVEAAAAAAAAAAATAAAMEATAVAAAMAAVAVGVTLALASILWYAPPSFLGCGGEG